MSLPHQVVFHSYYSLSFNSKTRKQLLNSWYMNWSLSIVFIKFIPHLAMQLLMIPIFFFFWGKQWYCSYAKIKNRLPPNPLLSSLCQLLPSCSVDDTMLPSRNSSTTHNIIMPCLLLFVQDSNLPPSLFSSDYMSCHCQSMSSDGSMTSGDPQWSDGSPLPS